MPNTGVQTTNPIFGMRTWLLAGLVVLVCLLAITPRSFWIDECYTARLAEQPTLQDCWQLLREVKGSDPQMPLYIFWIWSCEKIVGAGELALRAVNLCWFLPALVALTMAFAGNRRLQNMMSLTFILSPFVWYYLNEARSYTMQFSCSLIVFAAVIRWLREERISAPAERGWAFGFAVALCCLCGSSLLAMVMAMTPLLLLLAALPRKRLLELWKNFQLLWVVTLIALFGIGVYYLWTLHAGDRGTNVATTGWKNLIFIGYELTGFAGLGPGRLEIRNGQTDVFRPYALVLLTYAILVLTLVALATADLRRKFGIKKLLVLMLAASLPAGLVLAASAASHFRILGRHYSALFPVAILLLGFGLASAWRRNAAGRILVVAFGIFYVVSAGSLRFMARHEKDNYRAAAGTAKEALGAGKTVWWNADPNAAIYYHVPLVKTGATQAGQARWILPSKEGAFTAMTAPDMVISSRRDVYDDGGKLAGFLAQEHYHLVTNFTAFTVWERGID